MQPGQYRSDQWHHFHGDGLKVVSPGPPVAERAFVLAAPPGIDLGCREFGSRVYEQDRFVADARIDELEFVPRAVAPRLGSDVLACLLSMTALE